MTSTPRTEAFPDELLAEERKLLQRSRRARGRSPLPADGPDNRSKGLTMSGGGIRSATFGLGILQAMARSSSKRTQAAWLREIDYLSTVSGGGYIGAFFGLLFRRSYVGSFDDVRRVLLQDPPQLRRGAAPDERERWLAHASKATINWLRESGKYMSPRGTGDSLLALAAIVRNWIAVMVVLCSMLLAGGILLQIVRQRALPRIGFGHESDLQNALLSTWLWWSPFVDFTLVPLALLLPFLWAYWLSRDPMHRRPRNRLAGRAQAVAARLWFLSGGVGVVLALAGLALALSALGTSAPLVGEWWNPQRPHAVAQTLAQDRTRWLLWGLFAAALASALTALLAAWIGRRSAATSRDDVSAGLRSRQWLTVSAKNLLLASGAVLALGLVDSVGQTAWAHLSRAEGDLWKWVAAIGTSVAAAVGFSRHLVILTAGSGSKRPGLPTSIISTAAGLGLAFIFLVLISIASHAFAYNFDAPLDTPRGFFPIAAPATVEVSADVEHWTLTAHRSARPPAVGSDRTGHGHWPLVAIYGVGIGLIALALGARFSFLNRSSHHTMYAARLTRAYLGASNPRRWEGANFVKSMLDTIRHDDIEVHLYWPPLPDGVAVDGTPDPYGKGAPLHFVNVTINETKDGRSQIESGDRRGVAMALGPAAVSVGTRHHVVLGVDPSVSPHCRRFQSLPKTADYRVFAFDEPDGLTAIPWEPLSLGKWIAISGAAFSTGVGWRTSVGLSLLAGLTNVRLGYWWDSGISEVSRQRQRELASGHASPWPSVASYLPYFFRAQRLLLRELTARFHGTAKPYWYLTDGGHFENMGGYELIRRRLPLTIIVDAEADAAYTFDGLSNLVRKARLDFGAEVAFLSAADLDQLFETGRGDVPAADGDDTKLTEEALAARRHARDVERTEYAERRRYRALFGPLEALRWDLSDKTPSSTTGVSSARCAIARIAYEDDPGFVGWMLYLKPTLRGNEPADVTQYAASNRPFPQQSTADQFFDEAQWESYRKLGEQIGQEIFDGAFENPFWLLDRLGVAHD